LRLVGFILRGVPSLATGLVVQSGLLIVILNSCGGTVLLRPFGPAHTSLLCRAECLLGVMEDASRRLLVVPPAGVTVSTQRRVLISLRFLAGVSRLQSSELVSMLFKPFLRLTHS
jgi:hypothetical protein